VAATVPGLAAAGPGADDLDEDWGEWEDELAAVSYSRIPTIMRRWLWPGVLPIGNPALFAGKGSVGKGVLFALVAAHIVLGIPFPGTAQYAELEAWRTADPATRGERPGLGEAGRVIWIAGMEDDQFEDLAPRLRAAIRYLVALYELDEALAHHKRGAIRFVHDLSEWPDGSAFALPVDCDRLASTAKELNTLLTADNRRRDPDDPDAPPPGPPVRLVVMDPLSDLISDEPAPGVNGARQRYTIDSRQGARRTLRPVKAMARKLDISVVIIHHLTQDGKVAGSPAVLDCLRLAFVISARKDDPSVRVITQHKSNISDTPPQQYTTACGYPDTHAAWIAAADERAERVRAASTRPASDAGSLRDRVRAAAGQRAPVAGAGLPGGPPGPYGLLRRAGDASPEVMGREYAGQGEACAAAAEDAGETELAWQPGDAPGVAACAVKLPTGELRGYSVFPVRLP
jgi:hypothetical protein